MDFETKSSEQLERMHAEVFFDKGRDRRRARTQDPEGPSARTCSLLQDPEITWTGDDVEYSLSK